MASELIDKVRGIRGTSFTLTDGSEHVLLTSEESRKIIEALQAMEDLETVASEEDEMTLTRSGFAFWCVNVINMDFMAISIPEALRSAAEAIQKGVE